VASAIVLPGNEPPPPEPSLKRKQFDEDIGDSDSTKRARTYDSHNGHKQIEPIVLEQQGTRRIGADEERQRGKRMFGALLGVIGGGPSARGRQRQQGGVSEQVVKRRIEIEKRAQEKLKQVNEESKTFHTEQREQMKKLRRKYQWDLDEDSVSYKRMRVAFSNICR
jgi:hypothetical protein